MLKIIRQDPVALGNAIHEARRAKKMTQNDLAEAAGVTQSQVSSLENGSGNKVSAEKMVAVLEALDLKDWILQTDPKESEAGPAALYCAHSDCPTHRYYLDGSGQLRIVARAAPNTSPGPHCSFCGVKLRSTCPSCDEPLGTITLRCPSCGDPLAEPPQTVREILAGKSGNIDAQLRVLNGRNAQIERAASGKLEEIEGLE